MKRALEIIPAIDLRGGRCVRLERGDPNREKRYDDDPVARAQLFVKAGARRLHVVDLDGAMGTGENQAALHAICAGVDVPVQTGGGIRTLDDVRDRFRAGAAAIVLGTMLVEAPELVRAIAAEYGSRVIAGIDARGEQVATRGWLDHTLSVDRDTLVRNVMSWGIGRVAHTEIARDGMGDGYDIRALSQIARVGPIHVTASGGAKTIEDLLALRNGTPDNVDAAIIGRAVYEGTIEIGEAIATLAADAA